MTSVIRSGNDGLPSRSGHTGEYLRATSTATEWADPLPDQTGHADKALFTDGTDPEWRDVPDGLPDQTGHAGEYLTTNGTAASWGPVSGGGATVTNWARALRSTAAGTNIVEIRAVHEAEDGSVYAVGYVELGSGNRGFCIALESDGTQRWLAIDSVASTYESVSLGKRGNVCVTGIEDSGAYGTYHVFNEATGAHDANGDADATGYTFSTCGVRHNVDGAAILWWCWNDGANNGVSLSYRDANDYEKWNLDLQGAARAWCGFFTDGTVAVIACDPLVPETVLYAVSPLDGTVMEQFAYGEEVVAAAVDRHGRMWAHTVGGVLRCFASDGSEIISIETFAEDPSCIAAASEATGGIWHAFNNTGFASALFRVNGGGAIVAQSYLTHSINSWFNGGIPDFTDPVMSAATDGRVVIGWSGSNTTSGAGSIVARVQPVNEATGPLNAVVIPTFDEIEFFQSSPVSLTAAAAAASAVSTVAAGAFSLTYGSHASTFASTGLAADVAVAFA